MSLHRRFFNLLALSFALFALAACTCKRGELGSKDNPVKFFLVPSVDARMLEGTGKLLKRYLEANTPYVYSISVPSSYIAVVESFGTKRADVAAINTFGYLMANDRFGTEARITFIRFGREDYKAQIIARSDSGIEKIEDIHGRKFAYVDPASTSGYLMPAKLFQDNNIKPSETVFAKRHDNVVTMIYQGQVQAGATFYSPSENGKIEDARRLVKTQFPDVEEKVKIVALTDPIPNDPIVFRNDLTEEMKAKITDALIAYQESEEGKKVFYDIYGITGMVRSTDSRYDGVRSMLQSLGTSAKDLTIKK